MNAFRTTAIAALALVLPMLPTAAAAEEWAELSWNASRYGPGSIIYRRDLLGATPNEDGGVTLANSIASFEITAWYQLSDRYQFNGTGGSVTTRMGPCELTPSPECSAAHVTFELGHLSNGDTRPWQVEISLPWHVDLQPDGRLPLETILPEFPEGGWSEAMGRVVNPQDGTSYLTLDIRNTVFHRAVAAPVPEPETALLAALGVVAVAVRTARRCAAASPAHTA